MFELLKLSAGTIGAMPFIFRIFLPALLNRKEMNDCAAATWGALRSSVIESVPGQWDKRFAVHVGGLTLGLVRFGSLFFNLPPEPKPRWRPYMGRR